MGWATSLDYGGMRFASNYLAGNAGCSALDDLILAKEASDRERDQLLVKELRYIAALIRARQSTPAK